MKSVESTLKDSLINLKQIKGSPELCKQEWIVAVNFDEKTNAIMTFIEMIVVIRQRFCARWTPEHEIN